MRRFMFVCVVLAVLLSIRLRADEGRIPIFQPMTITQPGHYVVTRNVSAPGTVIRVAVDNVVLDLNGHSLVGPSGCVGAPDPDVIVIDVGAGALDVVIRNGHLVNGCSGIFATGTGVGQPRPRIRIEDLEIEGPASTAIWLESAESADIIRCYIHDIAAGRVGSGILVNGSTGSFGGRIVDNKIERVSSSGIFLWQLYNGIVRGNVVSDCGSFGGAGISLGAGFPGDRFGGNLVEGNSVSCLPSGVTSDGIHIAPDSPNNYLRSNVVRRNGRHGIWSRADGSRLEGNVVSANGSHGLRIGDGAAGLRNHLDRNQSQDNIAAGSCGISFDNGATHVYSNNNVRGNAVGGFCGLANTDAGGNLQ